MLSQLYPYMEHHSPIPLSRIRRTFLTKQHLSRAIPGIRNTCHSKDPRFTEVPICSYMWQPQAQLTHDHSERIAFVTSLEPDLSGMPSAQVENLFWVSSGLPHLPYKARVMTPDRARVPADSWYSWHSEFSSILTFPLRTLRYWPSYSRHIGSPVVMAWAQHCLTHSQLFSEQLSYMHDSCRRRKTHTFVPN